MFKFKYPLGRLPENSSGGTVQPCVHCHLKFRLSKWDSWNGFLTKCPHCKKLHGKHMNPKGILWASFFINAFSFFFTIRWRSALWMFGIFVAVGMVGNYLMQIEALPQILEFCLVIVFLFLPVIINGVLLAIHESELNHADASNGEKAYDLAANIKDLVS